MTTKTQKVVIADLPPDHSVRVLDDTLRNVANGEAAVTSGAAPSGTERMRAAVALVLLEYHLKDGKLSGKEIAAIYHAVNGDVSKDDSFLDLIGDLLGKLID